MNKTTTTTTTTMKMNKRACTCYFCNDNVKYPAGTLYAEIMRGKGFAPRYKCKYHLNNPQLCVEQSQNATDKIGEAKKAIKIIIEFYGNNKKAEAIKPLAVSFGTYERMGANRFKVTSNNEQGLKKLSSLLQHIDEDDNMNCIKAIHAECNGKSYDVEKIHNRIITVKELQKFRGAC